jgi:hypothetical protein
LAFPQKGNLCANAPTAFACKKYHPAMTHQSNTRTAADASSAHESVVTPQFLHREAASQLEKAVRHHRQAALLHDAGDARQAETHGNIAHRHTAQALEVSERALKVQLW